MVVLYLKYIMELQIGELLESFSNKSLKIELLNKTIRFTKSDEKNSQKYTVKLFIRNDNKINLKPIKKDNIKTVHFCDIINNSDTSSVDNILEFVNFIKKLNVYNYCIVCHQPLDCQSINYIPCENEECIYKYEEMIINNPVTEKFKQDPSICKFLLQSGIDAINSHRKFDIFEPFPRYFLNKDVEIKRGTISKLNGQNYDSFKDFNKINNVLEKFSMVTFKKIMHDVSSDKELAKILGKDLYILIRFIIMSCNVNIEKNDSVLDIKSDKFKIYKIQHYPDKEDEFNKMPGKRYYIFHGSNWCNWYSILRNGLKNCSHTKLMTAGAAYGNGIYLSDDINVSLNYGASGGKSVIGVFEIIDKDNYGKGNRIFVCDQEKALIQRYLLILPIKNQYEGTQLLNKIFNETIYEDKAKSNLKYSKKSLSKIVKEYQKLNKLKSSDFRIDVNPNYPFEWKIFLTKFDDNTDICKDMKELGIKEIELEIRFPENYPFSPPFLRVVKPRFQHLTAHITSAGAFCQELLTDKGWVPTCSIESLITVIMTEIVEGGGRIDKQRYNIPYSINEAKESFIRVAKSHGWL